MSLSFKSCSAGAAVPLLHVLGWLPTVGSSATTLTVSVQDTVPAPAPSLPPIVTTVWAPMDYGLGHSLLDTYASVIAADATATTYRLDCSPNAAASANRWYQSQLTCSTCTVWPENTLTAGPSTARYYATLDDLADDQGRCIWCVNFYVNTGIIDCSRDPSLAWAQCVITLGWHPTGNKLSITSITMDPVTGTGYEVSSQAITITAGLEKIAAVNGYLGGDNGQHLPSPIRAASSGSPQATTGSLPLATGPSMSAAGTQEAGKATETESAPTGIATAGASSSYDLRRGLVAMGAAAVVVLGATVL